MKKITTIIAILLITTGCSTTEPKIVEHRDIFKDFKELSNTICGGDFLYDSNGNIYNSIKRQLIDNNQEEELIEHAMCLGIIENHLINNNIREMSEENMNILFAETMNLILYKNENLNKI